MYRPMFRRWSNARKAKFVDFRMRGMHTHWAVFWSLIDREIYELKYGHRAYSEAQVEEYLGGKDHEDVRTYWTGPMEDKETMPPQWLFDALEKTE